MTMMIMHSCCAIKSPWAYFIAHHIIWASLGLIGIIWLRIMGFAMAGWIVEDVQEGVWTCIGGTLKAAIIMGVAPEGALGVTAARGYR